MTLTPDFTVFSSFGNDSIALLEVLHRQEIPATVLYSNTGWAAPGWAERVSRGAAWARERGFSFIEVASVGMESLIFTKKAWPRQGMQFCTEELKIKPALAVLDDLDPDKESICVVGIRREESRARRGWPEFTEESPRHGNRSLWAPIIHMTKVERDELLYSIGWPPLPHRSRECYPCINSNRADLCLLTEDRISFIEHLEYEMGYTSNDKPRTMFRPYRHMGAIGIREVVRWARSGRGKFQPFPDCDSGFCGD